MGSWQNIWAILRQTPRVVLCGHMLPRDVAAQLTAKMPNCAAFLFCGHGYGGAYLESAVASNFMSAVLLMGCSSGALSRVGDFEAKGMALELLARGLRSLLLCCGTSQIVILIVSLCICYSQ